MIVPFLLLAAAASAQMTDPSPATVKRLHDDFTESIEEAPRVGILERLGATAPSTPADVDALYDLFMRFPDERVRAAALRSLFLMNPSSPYLEPIFERYFGQPEHESKLFALKGLLILKDEKALPDIRALAGKKFAVRRAEDSPLLGERNAFWVQYEALSDLAQWKPEESLPLLVVKSAEAPIVARLIGAHAWAPGFAQIVQWSKSAAAVDRERAEKALAAWPTTPALRKTREAMLALVRDPKAPKELRHQLALKAGASSTPNEVAALLKEQEAASDPDLKLLLAAALFASRDLQVAPLLVKFLKESPEANVRAGALIQLKDMLAAKDFAPLAEWVEKNDPEKENREAAAAALKAQPSLK